MLLNEELYKRKRPKRSHTYTKNVCNVEHILHIDPFWYGAIQIQIVGETYRWVWMKDCLEIDVFQGQYLTYEHFEPIGKLIGSKYNLDIGPTAVWRGITECTLYDKSYPGVKIKKGLINTWPD